MPDQPELLTTAEVSELTRIPESTLRYLRWQNRGPRAAKLGRRVVYRREDVLTWIEENTDDMDDHQ